MRQAGWRGPLGSSLSSASGSSMPGRTSRPGSFCLRSVWRRVFARVSICPGPRVRGFLGARARLGSLIVVSRSSGALPLLSWLRLLRVVRELFRPACFGLFLALDRRPFHRSRRRVRPALRTLPQQKTDDEDSIYDLHGEGRGLFRSPSRSLSQLAGRNWRTSNARKR